jgi:predicted transcriptional regulator
MSLEHAPERDESAREKLADDLLIGAPAIADELGVTEAAVYYLYRMKRLPIGKLGKNLIATRSKLRRATHALTA